MEIVLAISCRFGTDSHKNVSFSFLPLLDSGEKIGSAEKED
jgi:hypothetical protein